MVLLDKKRDITYYGRMANIILNVESLKQNIEQMKLLIPKSVSLNAVTKFCLSRREIIELLQESHIDYVCDSNLTNIHELYNHFSKAEARLHTSLIKTRMSDIAVIAKIGRIVSRMLISDTALLEAARAIPKEDCPDIVLITELGDFKDGMYPDDIRTAVSRYQDLPIIGVSANFACLSGTMPEKRHIETLARIAEDIHRVKKTTAPFVSIGGTVALDVLQEEGVADLVSEIRCGEGLFFGYNSSAEKSLLNFNRNVFTFHAEILEISQKNITAQGSAGHTALGTTARKKKQGVRRYAVLDVGVLAAFETDLLPKDKNIEFVGQTFDFTVMDITHSAETYKVGGMISFDINYAAGSVLFINRFVEKRVMK